MSDIIKYPYTDIKQIKYGNRIRLKTCLRMLSFENSEIGKLLELDNDTVFSIVRGKYLKQARRYHPDICGREEKMKSVNYAFTRFRHLIAKRKRGYSDCMMHIGAYVA